MTAKKNMGIKIKIIIDTREQMPFLFKGYPCDITVGTLATGDYSVEINGAIIENGITVERKTLNDLIGALSRGRERFEAELARMKPYSSCAVIVESPFRMLAKGEYTSAMNPYAAVQSVLSMMQKFRVPFLFAESRRQAEFMTFHLLRHFYRHNI